MKIPYLIILLAVSLLGSCNIMDDEVCSGQSSPITAPVQVGFTLTTGDVSSRAIQEGTEDATERENYIDIPNRDFMFLLFDEENKYLTTFQVDNITQLSENENNGQKYYVTGELSEPYSSFKLVVLANWGKAYPKETDLTPEVTTIEQVCSATTAIYTYDGNFDIDKNLIPMYGVHTYEGIQWRADLLTELKEEVDLLRAMAKIEVNCTAEGFKLDGVTLHRYNTTGYCAPLNVYSDTQTDWKYTENDVCEHTTHIPDEVETSESSLPFIQQGENYIVYVPEFENKGVTDKSYISVSLVHKDDNTPVTLDNSTINFCEYNEGTPVDNTDFDIVRNHWYSYNITKVDDGIKLQCRVMPWEGEQWTIEWSNTYKFTCTVGKGAQTEAGGGTYYEIVYTAANDPSQSNDLFITFRLDSPAGTRWVASMDNGQDFFFCDPDNENPSIEDHYVPGGYAGDKDVTIRIKAFGPYNPDNPQQVRFAIRVLSPEGTWNRLMNLTGENSGEDYILIKQVAN